MPTLPAESYYAEIEASTAKLAIVVDSADPQQPIPTCPDWTLRQLATHLGRAQRWATEIVRSRSDKFIDFKAVPDGKLPSDESERGRWLTTGAARLVAALRDAGDEQVWAFDATAPASFWARRMSHEVMVHCADAHIATGAEVAMPAELAADAIDEWLLVLSRPMAGQPDRRLAALPPGRSLHVHTTDSDLAGSGEWLVTHADDDSVQVASAHGKADVALTGSATDVLLVLLGRLPVSTASVRVHGESGLLNSWLKELTF
ncbi:MAG TPA: maleylpyruvate isomerase family mycothiol-dependent enzyme [Streptosporangiaceae bacterium]|nr:maleylpyruvate isomerase family mycothiol-dependent enzyme [Streptosporangiaceae bacterium]